MFLAEPLTFWSSPKRTLASLERASLTLWPIAMFLLHSGGSSGCRGDGRLRCNHDNLAFVFKNAYRLLAAFQGSCRKLVRVGVAIGRGVLVVGLIAHF